MNDPFQLKTRLTGPGTDYIAFRIALERAATRAGNLTQGNDDNIDSAKVIFECMTKELGI